jgi:tRNA (cmo5U34)-methyltransferase
MAHDNSTSHASSDYDDDVIRTIPYYTNFHRETIDLVGSIMGEPAVWLDTGSGTGYLPSQALSHFPGTRFLLADPSAAMLDKAHHRLANFPAERFSILPPMLSEELHGNLPLQPDVVTAVQCHHYGGDRSRRAATSTIFHLLPAGGLYITFENIRPDSTEGTVIGLERWMNFQRQQGRSREVVENHRTRFDSEYFPITVTEHLDLLRESGFSVTELFWRSQMQAGFYAVK